MAKCHNELDSIDYTYRSAMNDIDAAIKAAKPRYEGYGLQRHNVRQDGNYSHSFKKDF